MVGAPIAVDAEAQGRAQGTCTGWFLRGSIRFGPLRLNLSKRGLGRPLGGGVPRCNEVRPVEPVHRAERAADDKLRHAIAVDAEFGDGPDLRAWRTGSWIADGTVPPALADCGPRTDHPRAGRDKRHK